MVANLIVGLYGLGGLPRFAKICRILQLWVWAKLRLTARNASLLFLTSVYGTEGWGFESLQARSKTQIFRGIFSFGRL
jgi:hypothetical protein